ncbi:MAG: hypothetical protein Q9219_006427 [cf. Caloplaca sp. 3 TL-2023]
MSSIRHVHHRVSPPGPRKTVVKATRLTPLGAPKLSLKANGKVKQPADKSEKKESQTVPDSDDEDDGMATSFLQFCCKRIDAEHIPDYISYPSFHSPTSNDDTSNEKMCSKNHRVVERATPTPRPMRSARIPPKAHEGKSDLDPTEWKPKLPHRPNSDAFKYLGQFHRTSPTTSWSPRRPAAIHAQTMSSVPLTAPSLSATPSASSTSSSGGSVAGTPYDFVDRPLMHPNATAVKSVDLVIPQLPSAFSVPAKPAERTKVAIKVTGLPATARASENIAFGNDLNYEKKWDLAHIHGPAVSGSLTTLLGSSNLGHKGTM